MFWKVIKTSCVFQFYFCVYLLDRTFWRPRREDFREHNGSERFLYILEELSAVVFAEIITFQDAIV